MITKHDDKTVKVTEERIRYLKKEDLEAQQERIKELLAVLK